MGKIAITLTVILIFGKAAGFVREILFAYFWGASYIVDSYLTAASIGGILFGWLISVSSCYMPVYLEVKANQSPRDAQKFTGKLIGMVTVTGVVAMLLIILFRDPIVSFIVPGYSVQAHQLTVFFLVISISSLVVIPIVQILKFYLEANQYFVCAAFPDLVVGFSQVGIIGICGFFNSDLLGLALIVPYCFQLVIMILVISFYKMGVPFSLGVTKEIKKIYILLLPIFASNMLSEINSFIDKMFASHLKEGSVAMLNYACSFRDILLNIFIAAFLTISYPILSKKVVEHDFKKINNFITEWVRNIFTFFVPLTFGAILLSDKVITILYMRGDFTRENMITTTKIFVAYSCALVPLALIAFLLKVCYSFQNTKIPFYTSGITVILNILLNVLLVKNLQSLGLAFATSIASWIGLLFLIKMMKNLNQNISFIIDKKELVKIAISVIVMVTGMKVCQFHFMKYQEAVILNKFIVEVLVGILLYCLCMWRLKSRTFKMLQEYIN